MIFEDPATAYVERIIDLHHEIFFYLIVLSVFGIWFLIKINFLFKFQIILVLINSSKIKKSMILKYFLTYLLLVIS